MSMGLRLTALRAAGAPLSFDLICPLASSSSSSFSGKSVDIFATRLIISVLACGDEVSLYSLLGWFSKRTGTSVDDGARNTNTRIWSDQNRIQVILGALQSSSDVPVLLLNQPIFHCRTDEWKVRLY